MNRWWLALCVLWLNAVAMPLQAAGIEVVDDRGVTVRWDAPPQRIVALLPSLTETVHALGEDHRLVGVDRYSNWPAALARLPRVGGGIDPNVEAIVALRPDAVLLARSSRVVERLESLGLKVVALEPDSHADVQRMFGQVGQLLGVDAARTRRLWREIDAGVSAAAQSLPPRARGTRVYFEVNRAPYGAGTTSFIGETLVRLGVQNILPPDLGAFPRINPEFVVRARPDVIMSGDQPLADMVNRPGWAGMRAVRENRVCVFPEAESDVLVRPGPRMAEAARIMARCLQEKAP